MKSVWQRDMCTHMAIVSLSTVAKTWNLPRLLAADECIKKMWNLYTMKNYSAMKKNDNRSFVMEWMELEIAILSAISQAQKVKYCIISLICRI